MSFWFGMGVGTVLLWFFGAELLVLSLPLCYGAYRRKVPLRHVLACIPALYVVKAVNFGYAWKAMVVELVLVPLGFSDGLRVYEKGRADAATARAAWTPCHRRPGFLLTVGVRGRWPGAVAGRRQTFQSGPVRNRAGGRAGTGARDRRRSHSGV